MLEAKDKGKLSSFFNKKKEVILAYIFGSQAKDSSCSLSDVDIAVYVDEGLEKDERFDVRLRLITEICSILGSDKVDLIILNDAPLRLYYNVLKSGQILYSKDELKRVRTEAKVMSKYLDQKYYQNRHNKILLEQVKKEGIL